ncbi:MAG TPA: alpha/beta hydrolase [Corynebacteriales bacterium]|nr:alpha/beta hydrolase [Mycobacteriales bacterium]
MAESSRRGTLHSRSRRVRRFYGIVGGLALVAGLITAPFTPAKAAAAPGDPLQWGPCPKNANIMEEYPTECATFQVPMDYSQPHREKITLTMSRMKAQGKSKGVIFTNPGGPGGLALDLWNWIVDMGAAKDLWKDYDLIAVQPRGLVSATALLPCVTEEQAYDLVSEVIADDEKQAQKDKEKAEREGLEKPAGVVDDARDSLTGFLGDVKSLFSEPQPQEEADGPEITKECVDKFLTYFRTVNTENTARDFDMARQYLGEDVIHYYGASYGTYLGAVYLSLFPEHTGRFVLDSGIDPDWVWYRGFEAQADSQRERMYEMFEFIAEHNDIYHLGDTPLKVYTKWYNIVNEEMGGPGTPRITAPPAQIGDVPPAYQERAEEYLQAYNAGRPVVDRFTRMLQAWLVPPFAAKEGTDLATVTSSGYTSRRNWPKIAYYMQHRDIDTSLYETEELPALATSGLVFLAVVCNENAVPPKVLNLPGVVTGHFSGQDMFEINKRLTTSGVMCALFPPTTKPVPVANKNLKWRPLVLQSLKDTQTVYVEGAALASLLNAYFVTVAGGDHGVYVQHSPKAWTLVNDYLNGKPVTEHHLPYAEVQKLIYKPKAS